MAVPSQAIPGEVVQLRGLVKRIEQRLNGKIRNPDRPPLPQRHVDMEADAARDRIHAFREVLRAAGATLRSESSTGAQEWVMPEQGIYISIVSAGEFIVQRNATVLTRGTEPQRLRDWLS